MRRQKVLTRMFTAWVLLSFDEQIGQWVAHDLESDLLAQGDSVSDAMDSLADITLHVRAHEISHGVVTTQPAPEEFWRERDEVVKRGKPTKLETVETLPNGPKWVVVNIRWTIQLDRVVEEESSRSRWIPSPLTAQTNAVAA